jgi:MFS family permease
MTPLSDGALVRRFAFLTALRWFPIGLFVPIGILLMQARGLDLPTIGAVFAVYGIVALTLELPTGGLADVVGRRTVLVAASFLNAVSLATAAFAQEPLVFAAGMAVGAAARALGSGPLEAWFVDAVGPGADGVVRRGLSRAGSAEALALGLGAVVGGLVPVALATLLPQVPSSGHGLLITLSIPALLASAGMIAHGIAVLALVGDDRKPWLGVRGLVRGIPATVVGGARFGLRDGILRRLLLRAVLLGLVLSGVELLTPGVFANLLGGEAAASGPYGLLVAAAFGASALGAAFAPTMASRFGGTGRAAGLAFALAAPVALLVAVPFLAAAGLGYAGVYLLLGVAGPLTSELLHGRVTGSERATMVSVESLALQAGGVASNLVLGAVAASAGTGVAITVMAIALVASSLLLLDAARAEARRRASGRPAFAEAA